MLAARGAFGVERTSTTNRFVCSVVVFGFAIGPFGCGTNPSINPDATASDAALDAHVDHDAPHVDAPLDTSTPGALSVGYDHACAVTNSGGARCWGNNAYGQLGNNSTTNANVPTDVSGLVSGVSAVSSGNQHACALTTSGGVKCWGSNFYGTVGDNTTTDRDTPVDVIGLSAGVSALAIGGGHCCALTTGGGVKCWGNNVVGQVGDGTAAERHAPRDVSGLTGGVSAVASGGAHSCALTSGGGVKCWGNNDNGELGDNTTTERHIAVDVSGLTSGVVAISTGDEHTCALTSGGGVKCWGDNLYGQIGNNSTTDALVPSDVVGLSSGVISIAAGYHHTCAITSGGGAKCWGDNYAGALGNNSTTDSRVPVDVIGISTAVAVSIGEAYGCALSSGGALKCWGENFYGQLGDGTNTDSHIPVAVVGFP